MKTVEELLMPRRKVIADYPGCEFEIGQIITFTHKSDFFTGSMDWVSEFTKTKDGKVQFCIKKIEPYPHLFQPLPWWSDRKVEELLSVDQVWRDISDYEGLYQVSNLGLIKSLSRSVSRSFKGKIDYKAQREERLLKLNKRPDGYLTIQLSKNNSVKTYYAHVLAADAFLDKIEGKLFINHIDSDRSNPMVNNLERCTQSENLKHAVKTNNYSEKAKQRFDRSPNKEKIIERIKNAGKFKAQPVKRLGESGETLDCFSSVAEAAKVTGFSSSGIHSQVTRKSESTKYRFEIITREEYEAYNQQQKP